MNQNQMIEKLKNEAANSPILNAVLHMFALRKRARGTLTMIGLQQKMSKEGFNYTEAEYAQVLRTLAQSGLGVLESTHKGKVLRIKGIQVTLQSVGQAVVGQGQELKTHRAKRRYLKLVSSPKRQAPVKKATEPKAPVSKTAPLVLTALIAGKKVNLSLPEDFTAEDMAGLIEKLWGKEAVIFSDKTATAHK